MVKKMKFSSLFKATDAKSSWPWPSCQQHPRTLSFRSINTADVAAAAAAVTGTTDSYFTISPECGSFSTVSESESSGGDPIERMIRGLRSERLLFEPTGKTSSILRDKREGKPPLPLLLKEENATATMLLMESRDPYLDFRKSMEEMVEAHCLKDWENLEELLSCYLKVNEKSNHDYIVGAFLDLLVGLTLSSSSSSSVSSSSLTSEINSHYSPLSLCSSSFSSSSSLLSSSSFIPCLSSSMEIDQEEEIPSLDQKNNVIS